MRWILAVLFAFALVSSVAYAAGVTLNSPVDNSFFGGSMLLNATTSVARDNVTFYYNDGSDHLIGVNTTAGTEFTLSWDSTGVSDGNFVFKAVTNLGDTAVAPNVTIDNTAPVITLVDPTPSNLSRRIANSETINVSIYEAGSGLDSCWLDWNGAIEAMTRVGNGCYATKATADGTDYAYKAYANDTVGNVGVSEGRAFRENAAPSITSAAINPDPAYTNDDMTCSAAGWSDADSDSEQYHYRWYKDGVLQYEVLSSFATDLLGSGNTTKGDVWNCTVVPFDGYENGTMQYDDVTISNSAPTMIGLSYNSTAVRNGGAILFMAEDADDADGDPMSLRCGSATGLADLCSGAFGAGNRTCEFTSAWSDDAVHAMYCRLNDGTDDSIELEINMTSDNTAPAISSAGPTGVLTSGSVTLSVATDENAVCRYADSDVAYESMSDFASTGGTSHSQVLSLGEGSYAYYFRCRDIAGNEAAANAAFSVDLPDNHGSGGSSHSGVTIVWVEENRTESAGSVTEETSEPQNENAAAAPEQPAQIAPEGPTGLVIANPAAAGAGFIMIVVGLWFLLRKFMHSMRPKF
ncbi:MAG: hypothetical protein QXU82_00325 [Candidatus Aenigmatarchaeota archaeon]